MNCASLLKTAAFSALLCTPLGGCDLLNMWIKGPPVVVKAQCPKLKEYSQETLSKAADELAELPVGSATVSLVKDYRQLRLACRTQ